MLKLGARLIAAAVLAVSGLSLSQKAFADDGTCYVSPDTRKIICEVENTVKPPSTRTTEPSDPGNPGDEGEHGDPGTPNVTDPPSINLHECEWVPLTPQPASGDPAWEGHDPSEGSVLMNACGGDVRYRFSSMGAVAPPPDPAVLAQRALTELVLPEPTLGRSPSLDAGDPAQAGRAYTVVNLWTRFFTDPSTWTSLSKTVAVQGVSATVTAVPTALVFDPGDGNDPVSCVGPGRAWHESDGFDPPGAGECGYQYTQVQAEPVTGTVSIEWSVSWTGTGGVGGDFPGLTTSASSQFLVQQIQIVVR